MGERWNFSWIATLTSITTAQKSAGLRNTSHHTIGGFILFDILGSYCQCDGIQPPDIIADRGFFSKWDHNFSFFSHPDFEDEVASKLAVMSLHGDWRHDMSTAVARDEDETRGGGG